MHSVVPQRKSTTTLHLDMNICLGVTAFMTFLVACALPNAHRPRTNWLIQNHFAALHHTEIVFKNTIQMRLKLHHCPTATTQAANHSQHSKHCMTEPTSSSRLHNTVSTTFFFRAPQHMRPLSVHLPRATSDSSLLSTVRSAPCLVFHLASDAVPSLARAQAMLLRSFRVLTRQTLTVTTPTRDVLRRLRTRFSREPHHCMHTVPFFHMSLHDRFTIDIASPLFSTPQCHASPSRRSKTSSSIFEPTSC